MHGGDSNGEAGRVGRAVATVRRASAIGRCARIMLDLAWNWLTLLLAWC